MGGLLLQTSYSSFHTGSKSTEPVTIQDYSLLCLRSNATATAGHCLSQTLLFTDDHNGRRYVRSILWFQEQGLKIPPQNEGNSGGNVTSTSLASTCFSVGPTTSLFVWPVSLQWLYTVAWSEVMTGGRAGLPFDILQEGEFIPSEFCLLGVFCSNNCNKNSNWTNYSHRSFFPLFPSVKH